VATIIGMVRTRLASPAAWASVAAALGMIPVLMGSFGVLKMLLPLSMPFTWDDRLAAFDRALFLGTDPWRITHALFGSPFATQLLDIAYALWVPLVIIGVLIACCAEPYARARYLLSFAASWLLIGVLGAYCLSSAGPCFTGLLGTAEAAAYAPLMDRLHDLHAAIGLGAVDWQQELWVAYHGTEYGFAKGISAMPSMHNAIAFLYVLALANGPRFLRVGSWVFAAAIYVGSIHLGWHYAADGIAAGLMMWGIWGAAGFYLDRVGYGSAEAGAAAQLPGFAPEPVAI
jgi:hypothetical protein